MNLVLLDTNAYLRLGKRVKPLLGKEFGQKHYVLTTLKDVENEVHRSPRLRFHYPWFDNNDFTQERLAKRIRLSQSERAKIQAMTSVLRAHALEMHLHIRLMADLLHHVLIVFVLLSG